MFLSINWIQLVIAFVLFGFLFELGRTLGKWFLKKLFKRRLELVKH